MTRKEQLFAVIGGCVGAVLTMAVCSFFPLGVQSQSDRFGEITCEKLTVINSEGETAVVLNSNRLGGYVDVWGKDAYAGMAIGSEHGGRVSVSGKGGAFAKMQITSDGGTVNVSGRNGTNSASLP